MEADRQTELVNELEKDLYKSQIAIPTEACKTMGLGSLTIIGAYVPLLHYIGKLPKAGSTDVVPYLGAFLPIALFIFAATVFGRGYLPPWIKEVFPELWNPNYKKDLEAGKDGAKLGEEGKVYAPGCRVLEREDYVRRHLTSGLIWLWAGVGIALIYMVAPL